MSEQQVFFPPHFMGRGTREAGEGPPRYAAEWRSEVRTPPALCAAPSTRCCASAHFPTPVGKKSRNQIEKLVPQPQAAVALGLWILKAAPISSST